MSIRVGRPLPEWEAGEEPRDEARADPYVADTRVAVAGFDVPFGDVFAIVAKVIFSLLLIAVVLAIPAFLIFEGVLN